MSHPSKGRDGGDAGYRPRVRSAYCKRVYIHSPKGQFLYRAVARLLQTVWLDFLPKKAKGLRQAGQLNQINHAAGPHSKAQNVKALRSGGLSSAMDTNRPEPAPT